MARIDLIQYRRGTAANWLVVNPVLASGEVGFSIDANEIRIGDGILQWSALEPIGSVPESEIAQAVADYLAAHPIPGASDADVAGLVLDPASESHAAVLSLAIEGPRGPAGDPGADGASAVITGATAIGLAAGSAPTVTAGGTPSARTFQFGIPAGAPGADGAPGQDGTDAPGTIANVAGLQDALDSKENTLVAGANITIDRTNPASPIVSAAGGGGGGAVDSVNGKTGVVILGAADVGAATEAFVDDQIQLIDFPVDSVNGQQGSVVLAAGDVGAAPVVSAPNRLYATDGSGAQASRPVTDFATAAQGAKADTALQNAAAFATAAQGAKADTAIQPAGIANLVPNTRTVAGKPLSANVTLAKGDVGLGNVDNTSDAAKPVSTAQQTALNAKAPTASPTFTGTVSGVTKAHVGLGNVDNTSDANKPVSTAQATAISSAVSAAIAGLDMDSVARTVIVVTGAEARPTADVVLWADFREGEVSDPVNMTGNDFRFRPRGVGPTPVAPVITTTTLATLTEGSATSQPLAATGTDPIAWSVTAGALPAGLALSTGGLLSGTPTADGAYTFTVTATNSAGSDTQPYSGTVEPATPTSGMSIFGTATPGTGTTVENDGGGSLRTGARFYATKAIRALGLRVWNPLGADGTFLGTDVTAYAYVGDWDGGVSFGPITGAPVQTKAHTATRVAGEWTDILFDAPVPIAAIASAASGSDFVTLAIQFAGGNYYIAVSGVPDGDAVASPEDAAVFLAEGSFRRSVNSLDGSSTSTFYGIDMIFEVV